MVENNFILLTQYENKKMSSQLFHLHVSCCVLNCVMSCHIVLALLSSANEILKLCHVKMMVKIVYIHGVKIHWKVGVWVEGA